MQTDPTTSRRAVKTGVHGATAAPGRAVTWPDVLRALSSDEARSQALRHYRAACFGPDDFEHRAPARRAMVEALVRCEDVLDVRGVRRERVAIRDVRRALEVEVWP